MKQDRPGTGHAGDAVTGDAGAIFDVTDFGHQVLERSAEQPVLVDFWAPWCGPCRALGPVLEALTAEFGGAFALAKVNVDDHQEVAAHYGIRGIPDVKLFIDRAVAGGFVGALPEPQVRAFLRQHCPSDADKHVATGKQALLDGDVDAARAAFTAATDADPACATARLELARMALRAGEFDAIAQHVAAIPPLANEREAADYLARAVELVKHAREVGDEQALRARRDADPDDLDAHYGLGAYALAAGHYRESLDAFLAVAERKRKWRDEAARKAMLVVFGVIGVRHPLSDEYRRKLMLIY